MNLNHRTQELRDSERSKKSYWFHKRGWLKKDTNEGVFDWEISIHKMFSGRWITFEVHAGGEQTRSVSLHVGLLLVHGYFKFVNALPKSKEVGWYKRGEEKNPTWLEDSHGKTWGFYISENMVKLSWAASVIGSGPDKKWGWSWACFIDEKIFGRRNFKPMNERRHENIAITFPEAEYHLNIILSDDTWTYARWPRWPLRKIVRRAHIEVVEKDGIILPGKGENSWDCGDDALHGLTAPSRNLNDAVAQVYESVARSRKQYGSGVDMYSVKKESQVQS